MDAELPPDSPVTSGLTKHYEGFLEKKGPRDKDYEKQWIILLGDRMLAYPQRIAQREIYSTKPTDACAINKTTDIKPDSKEKTKLSIKCKEGTYKFKMNTPDERDNWWIRFHALAKMEIPKVHLLPGQIIALQEIIEDTKLSMDHYAVPSSIAAPPHPVKVMSTAAKSPTTKSPTTKSPTTKTFVKQKSKEEMGPDLNKQYRFYPDQHLRDFKDDCPIPPTWFFQVSRLQAEELLLNNQDRGAILIREGEAHKDFSLSMRQDPPRGNTLARPVIKHFRFVWDKTTFKLLIEEQQPMMATMYDLLAFFIDKHGGDIKPMQTRDPSVLKQSHHPYELGLRGAGKDPENGEPRRGHDTYLQPMRAAPDPPERPRPDRQSLPASFNMSYKQGENVGPGNRLQMQTSERAPQLPPPRQRRCVSTSLEDSPNLSNNSGELNMIFKKFGIDGEK